MENFKNIDLLVAMSDLEQFMQPSTTAVSTSVPSREDFAKNQTQNLANTVGSTEDGGYIEAGMPAFLVDALMGGSKKGLSILGKILSKIKFPVGYGYPTAPAHSSINKLIKAAEKTPKVEISNYIPNQLAKVRTKPDPNLYKMILRNDPSKLKK